MHAFKERCCKQCPKHHPDTLPICHVCCCQRQVAQVPAACGLEDSRNVFPLTCSSNLAEIRLQTEDPEDFGSFWKTGQIVWGTPGNKYQHALHFSSPTFSHVPTWHSTPTSWSCEQLCLPQPTGTSVDKH